MSHYVAGIQLSSCDYVQFILLLLTQHIEFIVFHETIQYNTKRGFSKIGPGIIKCQQTLLQLTDV